MKKFRLYGSEGCHLCEEALILCQNANLTKNLEQIDIVEHEQYFEQFKYSIPVLERLEDNYRLHWPFTEQQIKEIA